MAVPTHRIEDITSGSGLKSYVGPDETLYSFEVPMRSLDGFDYFARVISNLPRPGFPGEFAQEELVAERFLQVGGVSDAVTLDIRKDSEDGSTQHIYKLGHKPLAKHADENPDVEIRLGEHVEHVYAHELFTSDEAARIFHFYYKNNDVSDKYALRQLPM